MGYENATAKLLAATHCVCCGKALVDAVSVETGIGPVCRKKYLTAIDVDSEAHATANLLVYKASSPSTSNAARLAIAAEMEVLGFPLFAEIVRTRFLRKAIVLEATTTDFAGATLPGIIVRVPWSASTPAFNTALKKAVPMHQRKAVWEKAGNKPPVFGGWAILARSDVKYAVLGVLASFYKGQEAIGPKGPFTIGMETTG